MGLSIPQCGDSDTAYLATPRSLEQLLADVEKYLCAITACPAKTLEAMTTHIIRAGGKRLRPMLVILSAQTYRQPLPMDQLISLAASTELIHIASLLHDDVVDHARTRRGYQSVNVLRGNTIAVLTGDYLWAKAFAVLVQHADISIMRILADAATTMIEGEVCQAERRGDVGISVADYLEVIRAKTACLISACCHIGAMYAQGSPETIDLLTMFGLNLGMAFQITDDLLDYCADVNQIGKAVGNDISEGQVTLPLIFALAQATQEERDTIEVILRGGTASPAQITAVRAFVTKGDAIDHARNIATNYLACAVSNLHALPLSPARDSLEALAQFCRLANINR